MKLFSKKMSVKNFAMRVAQELEKNDIEVILVGGAVVSIYSKNKYQSKDVDFLSIADHQKIEEVMHSMGFKNQGKDYFHAQSKFSVEFPGRTLVIGDAPEKPEGKIKSGKFVLKLLSPTQCVMDRLAAFYHWKDRQSLEQALLVAQNHPIKLEKIKKWSLAEGMMDKFQIFSEKLKIFKKS